jgi:Flp pilus assembly protein TadG
VRKMLKKLICNQSGVSVTEFGLIAPVLLLMIMGTYDIGHQIYLRAMLNGALQEVGRDSSLEGASNADQRDVIDTKLRTLIADLLPKPVSIFHAAIIKHSRLPHLPPRNS